MWAFGACSSSFNGLLCFPFTKDRGETTNLRRGGTNAARRVREPDESTRVTAAESPRRYETPHSGGQFASREVGLGANREGSESGEDQPRRSLKPRPLGLGLLLFFPQKLEEARVGLIGHFRKHQQVVAPEALRTLPFTNLVLVETREGDVVPRLLFGSVRPDRGLDATDADFSDGFFG